MMLRRALIAGVVSLVVLTGCGAAEKLSPRVAVREAAQATINQKEGSFRVSLVGSEDDLNALFNDGAPLSGEDRQGLGILRNSQVAVSVAEDKFGLDVKVGSLDHAFEIRTVGEKVYARADIRGLAELFGGSPEEVDRSLREVASQPGLAFLADAAAGKWLVADLKALEGLEDMFGGAGGSTPLPTADPELAESQWQALKDAFGQALTEHASIEKVGSDAAGDHYVGKVTSLRTFYAEVRPALEQPLSKTPYGQQLPPADVVPDKPASLDVWVKDGRISRLEVDLAQFMPAPPAGVGRVAIRVDVDRDATAVSAPADATTLDIAGLLQNLFSQFAGFLDETGGAAGYD